MSLRDLRRVPASTVLGLDVSTKSVAFAIFKNGKPVRCGEIFLKGDDEYARAQDARRKTRALIEAGVLEADYVAIERAVFVNNMNVAIQLATVFGAVVSAFDGKVWKFTPTEWQNGIGNPTWKKPDKDALKAKHPDKSDSWLKNESRKIRKQRTMDFARDHFDIESESDNVSDAVGIAYFCYKEKVSSG